MRSKIKLIGLIIILVTANYSCSKDSNDPTLNKEGSLLKYILSKGKITDTYYYTSTKKLEKHVRTDICETYVYDNTDLLVEEKFYVKTDGKFILSEVVEYFYNLEGRLDSCKVSQIDNNVIRSVRIHRFDYVNNRIAKTRIHPYTDTTTSFFTFKYDSFGNMVGMKNFSKLNDSDLTPVWEMIYRYDNKNSPYKLFGPTQLNGVFCNKNNVTEIEILNCSEIPEWNQSKLNKFSYEYNKQGYPIKELNNEEEFEYRYY